MKHSITNNFRKLRFEYGEMSQQALADAIGVTRQTVFAIEKGKYSPSLEVAFKIAETFSVTLDKVFQYQGSEKLTLPDTDSPGFIGLLSRPVQSTRMVGPLNLG